MIDITVGTRVTFTAEFSTKLAGTEFEIDGEARQDVMTERLYVPVRTKLASGRWAYRLAWVDALAAL